MPALPVLDHDTAGATDALLGRLFVFAAAFAVALGLVAGYASAAPVGL